jgi:hypothetical protein
MRIEITQSPCRLTGETIDDGVVVLDGDRIENVSAEKSASSRGYDLTVDLEGRTLIPGMIDAHIHMAGGDKSLGFDAERLVMRTDLLATTKALLEGVGPPALRCGQASQRCARSAGAITWTSRSSVRSSRASSKDRECSQPGRASGRLVAQEPTSSRTSASTATGCTRRLRELVERGVDVIWRRQANVRFSLGASRRTSQMSSILSSRR